MDYRSAHHRLLSCELLTAGGPRSSPLRPWLEHPSIVDAWRAVATRCPLRQPLASLCFACGGWPTRYPLCCICTGVRFPHVSANSFEWRTSLSCCSLQLAVAGSCLAGAASASGIDHHLLYRYVARSSCACTVAACVMCVGRSGTIVLALGRSCTLTQVFPLGVSFPEAEGDRLHLSIVPYL
jgi:hypothetical protein